MYSVCSDALAAGKTNGLPVSRENAFALVTNDAVSRAPAPIRKLRRSSMDALLQLHTCIGRATYCCPHGPHRHSPPLPVKAGWRGRSPLWMQGRIYQAQDQRSIALLTHKMRTRRQRVFGRREAMSSLASRRGSAIHRRMLDLVCLNVQNGDRRLARLRRFRSDLIDPAIDSHRRRIVKRTVPARGRLRTPVLDLERPCDSRSCASARFAQSRPNACADRGRGRGGRGSRAVTDAVSAARSICRRAGRTRRRRTSPTMPSMNCESPSRGSLRTLFEHRVSVRLISGDQHCLMRCQPENMSVKITE